MNIGPSLERVLSPALIWCRQTTTVQGLAVLALTAVLQITQSVPLGVVAATAATSFVLLIMPGQGDLAGKIGRATADIEQVIATHGERDSVGALVRDSMLLVSLDNASDRNKT